jgi:hypothetical protein
MRGVECVLAMDKSLENDRGFADVNPECVR